MKIKGLFWMVSMVNNKFQTKGDLKHITARNRAHCKSVLCHAQLCLARNQCLIDQLKVLF